MRLLAIILCLVALAVLIGAALGVRHCDVAMVAGFVIVECLLPDTTDPTRRPYP